MIGRSVSGAVYTDCHSDDGATPIAQPAERGLLPRRGRVYSRTPIGAMSR